MATRAPTLTPRITGEPALELKQVREQLGPRASWTQVLVRWRNLGPLSNVRTRLDVEIDAVNEALDVIGAAPEDRQIYAKLHAIRRRIRSQQHRDRVHDALNRLFDELSKEGR